MVSWHDIDVWTKELAEKIKESGYMPDAIVGLTRGGWIPARLVCDILMVKNLYAVKTEHWGLTATKDGTAKLAQPLAVDVKDKNVLVIDDITDTGQSLGLALKHIKELKPANLKSGTLLHITHSQVVPDYYVIEVPKEEWTWFIFPWNFNEDIQSLVQKALGDAKSSREIKTLLQKHCKLTVDDHIIYDTLLTLAKKVPSDTKRIEKETVK